MSGEITPDAGAWSGGLHRLPVRVYYEDTDFTGVVYYANYLKFFERGRTDAMRTAGVGHAELLQGEPKIAFAIRRITVDYLTPARIDDALVVESRFTVVRGARLSVEQTIRRGEEALATAAVDAACITLEGRPIRLPKPALEALQALLKD